MDAVKTSVNIAARAHFAGVKPLQDSLRIGFVLDRTLDHPRALRSEKISSTQYSHVVKISGIDDIDEQLLGWMAEAYALKSW